MKRKFGVMSVATAVLLIGAMTAPVAAKSGDVVRTGDCSGSANWKLKGGLDDGRIKVEFEVDSNRIGQTWRVRLKDNGEVFFRGLRTTLAPSGSFTVEKRTANRAGTDKIVGFARNVNSGQTCRGVIRIG